MIKTSLAVVGSPKYPHLDFVSYYIWSMRPFVSVLISSGARGVGDVAAKTAQRHDIPSRVVLPEWGQRNVDASRLLLNTAIVDCAAGVVAFWDGKEQDTLDTITKARFAGKLRGVYTLRMLNVWNAERGTLDVYSRGRRG